MPQNPVGAPSTVALPRLDAVAEAQERYAQRPTWRNTGSDMECPTRSFARDGARPEGSSGWGSYRRATAYDQFTLDDVKGRLGLTVRELDGAFAEVPAVTPSAWLAETLREGSALALSYAT